MIHAGLGENDLAFESLDQAYRERNSLLFWITWPVFDVLRPDPRLSLLIRNLRTAAADAAQGIM